MIIPLAGDWDGDGDDSVGLFDSAGPEMIACHLSQTAWLKDHDQVDLLEMAMIQSAFRGLQVGVKHAQAFRQHRVWGRATARRWLP